VFEDLGQYEDAIEHAVKALEIATSIAKSNKNA